MSTAPPAPPPGPAPEHGQAGLGPAGEPVPLEAVETELARQEKALQVIDKDQGRMRSNMAQVPQTSQAYKRYLQKFDEQETEIEKRREQIAKLPYCGRVKYSVPTSLVLIPEKVKDAPDLFQTAEWFGAGAQAFHLTLASERFVNLVRERRWKASRSTASDGVAGCQSDTISDLDDSCELRARSKQRDLDCSKLVARSS